MSHRSLDEVRSEIARVKNAIRALPESAVRDGWDEDYMDELATLEEEEKALLAEAKES